MWPCTSKKDDFIRSSQGSWACTIPQVLRSGTTRRHYATLWSHANGRSMGYLRVIWSRGWKIRTCTLHVRFTCGHPMNICGFHMGMGTSIRSRADAVRAWEYLYDQWCRALLIVTKPNWRDFQMTRVFGRGFAEVQILKIWNWPSL